MMPESCLSAAGFELNLFAVCSLIESPRGCRRRLIAPNNHQRPGYVRWADALQVAADLASLIARLSYSRVATKPPLSGRRRWFMSVRREVEPNAASEIQADDPESHVVRSG